MMWGKKLLFLLVFGLSGVLFSSTGRRVAAKVGQFVGRSLVRTDLTSVSMPIPLQAKRNYGDITPYKMFDYPSHFVRLSRRHEMPMPRHVPDKVADMPCLHFFSEYGKELAKASDSSMPSRNPFLAMDLVRSDYAEKFLDQSAKIYADLQHFYAKSYPQIKKILGEKSDLVKDFEYTWNLYEKNPDSLDEYYHVAYVVNQMLNATSYHNQVQFVAKQIVAENPKGYAVSDIEFGSGAKNNAYYEQVTKTVTFCKPHRENMPALQRFTIEHELVHAQQNARGSLPVVYDSGDWFDRQALKESEHEADQGAATKTQFHVCLAIKQAHCKTIAPRSDLGYLSADEYQPYIDNYKNQNLLCEAHATHPDEMKAILRAANSDRPNMDKIAELDRKCGDLYEHFLPHRSNASAVLSLSGNRLPGVD